MDGKVHSTKMEQRNTPAIKDTFAPTTISAASGHFSWSLSVPCLPLDSNPPSKPWSPSVIIRSPLKPQVTLSTQTQTDAQQRLPTALRLVRPLPTIQPRPIPDTAQPPILVLPAVAASPASAAVLPVTAANPVSRGPTNCLRSDHPVFPVPSALPSRILRREHGTLFRRSAHPSAA
jgi:hypothetical protein